MEKIIEPTLIIDKAKCLANIERMAGKAKENNLAFRPHFKTHQSNIVGNWFRDFGVTSITVSSVSMAGFFSPAGWKDITIAFPLNILEIGRINDIEHETQLNLTIENTEAAIAAGHGLKRQAGVFIKIDTGYNRTGIWHENIKTISGLLEVIAKFPALDFRGFLIHAGHTYREMLKTGVLEVHRQSLEAISSLNEEFLQKYPGLIISYGDTPSCSLADDFSGIGEIRPGNFVFYDLMQLQTGSCTIDDIAVAVACPVVAKHPERNQVVIYGGAVHFSKEYILDNGRKNFGKSVVFNNKNWDAGNLTGTLISLSQEHGILEPSDTEQLSSIKIGDILLILPVHSCLTSDAICKSLILL